jgi:hypothetical protein
VKLNDWIDETVELQFVTREENGEPQKIRGNLESVGDRGVMLYYDETARGRLFFYPWHTIERVELSRIHESQNTQSPRLRFRALLTDGADPRVQLHRA